ncbi:MAG: hypothetical protein HQ564_06935 [Candidatus Saganbacteria bacterium]|nr:hypothetical protein [Candidatus Saganbacteria bacterium]
MPIAQISSMTFYRPGGKGSITDKRLIRKNVEEFSAGHLLAKPSDCAFWPAEVGSMSEVLLCERDEGEGPLSFSFSIFRRIDNEAVKQIHNMQIPLMFLRPLVLPDGIVKYTDIYCQEDGEFRLSNKDLLLSGLHSTTLHDRFTLDQERCQIAFPEVVDARSPLFGPLEDLFSGEAADQEQIAEVVMKLLFQAQKRALIGTYSEQ